METITRRGPELGRGSVRVGAARWPLVAITSIGVSFGVVVATGTFDRPWILLVVTALLTMAVAAAWRRATWWPALIWGAWGVTAGIGVGVRWLIVDGFSLAAGAGLAALLGGAGSIGASLTRITQARPGWARPLIVLPVTMGVAVFVWTLSPALIASNVPPTTRGGISPADLGLTAEEVTFPAPDGVWLAGWYLPSDDGKTVILRHGSGQTAASVLPYAALLSRNGFGVLLTDARGHGASTGEAMDFGWRGEEDLGAALDYLSTRPEVDMARVAVVGFSMGGEEAIGARGADRRVAAVVAEGATARTDEDKRWLPDVYGFRGSIQLVLERLQYGLTEWLTAAPRPQSLREAARDGEGGPILLIAGGDMPDEIEAAGFIADQAGSEVTVWVVPGSGHIQGLEVAPESWESTVVSFLDAALAG